MITGKIRSLGSGKNKGRKICPLTRANSSCKKRLKLAMNAEANSMLLLQKCSLCALNVHRFYMDMKTAIMSSRTENVSSVSGTEAEVHISKNIKMTGNKL